MHKKFISVFLIFASAVLLFSCNSKNKNEKKPRTIEVSGESSISVPVDQARIRLSIITKNRNIKIATENNNTYTANTIQAIKDCGVDIKDIRTTDYSINQEKDEIYNVYNGISVLVRNPENVGLIIDSAVGAEKANNISSVNFISSDNSEAEKQSKIKAVQNAYDNAVIYANAAGCSVGKVLTIEERNSYDYYNNTQALSFKQSDSTPILSGAIKITSSVNVIYEIK